MGGGLRNTALNAGGAKRVPVSADEPTIELPATASGIDRTEEVQFAMPATPASRLAASATPGDLGATPTLTDRWVRPHQPGTSVSGTPTMTMGALDANRCTTGRMHAAGPTPEGGWLALRSLIRIGRISSHATVARCRMHAVAAARRFGRV